MHECLSVQDWIKAWGDSEREGRQLATCPMCAPFRADLQAWFAAVERCPECRSALDATPIEVSEVVECPTCAASFAKLVEILDELEHFDPAVAAEVLSAEELFGRLITLRPKEQLARVTDDLRYQQWGLCHRLLGASRELWCENPERAHERAQVAAALADLLEAETYHPLWLSDLRAKAHAYLANTHRILGEFLEAEREFVTAERYLRRGVESGRCQAQVFSLKASLLVDQERFVEAGALLEKVEAYYHRAEDARSLALTRIQHAMVASGRGDYSAAAHEYARAASGLDPEQDRTLLLLARQNAVYALVHADEIEDARRLFDALPPAEGRSMELRRLWIEGDLLRAEGKPMLAMDSYQAARRGYWEDGRYYLMALVALEESLTAFDMGDTAEMAAMAEEASILLVKAAAKHQSLAVLRLLLAAIERGTVDRAMLVAVCRQVAALKPS
jgi:tetratricopeptide (TPR) repeat protein